MFVLVPPGLAGSNICISDFFLCFFKITKRPDNNKKYYFVVVACCNHYILVTTVLEKLMKAMNYITLLLSLFFHYTGNCVMDDFKGEEH